MPTDRLVIEAVVVEQELEFGWAQLGRACGADDALLLALVDEGLLEPRGAGPSDWVFGGSSLRIARTAVRLVDDLDLRPAGAVLVLELLARIDALQARLLRT